MGTLEERVYSNFFNNAILRVNCESASFYYYGLSTKAEETFPMQELGLENFWYLQSFLKETNHYMEMGYDKNKRLYTVVLCRSGIELGDKESTSFVTRELLYEKKGLNFLSIFELLEECLMKEKYQNVDKRIRKKLEGGGCFQICGSPKINGVYIYEEAQVKCISETEFSIEGYLRKKDCNSLCEAVLSGKIIEIRYRENQFVLELFYLFRASHQGPFMKVLEECVEGERLSICLEQLEN